MTRTDATSSVEEVPDAIDEHLLLDLYGVAPALLYDTAALEKTLRDTVSTLGTIILYVHLYRFNSVRAGLPAGEQGGVTGVLLFAESHLSTHTRPEHGLAVVDTFICGTGIAHAARAMFEQTLTPQRVDMRVACRDVEPASN